MKKIAVLLVVIMSVVVLGNAGYTIISNEKIKVQLSELNSEIKKIDGKEKEIETELTKLENENNALRKDLSDEIEDEKIVYLTFDDGPTPNNTKRILEILKKIM